MNVKYEFDNDEVTEVEVSEEFGAMIIDPRRKEESGNRKEHRHCYSLDTTAAPPSDDGGGLSIREIVKCEGKNYYPKCQTVSGKLSWSHYCELLIISDKNKRSFYEKEAINSNWSVRELKRQINTSLYERLLLSKGEFNKEQVLALAANGVEISEPVDIIKDPYVFEFLGIPENKPVMENDLEKALVEQIEKFLLELGRGFMFVGTQQRVTINNTHYYADMVFYNKPLKSYVIIELKTTKLMPEAVGQLNMYLSYYENEVNDEGDNKPIGIILCTDKDALTAEYALGGLSSNIFASKYTYYIPQKEQLIAEVEKVINRWHEDNDEK